MEEHDHDERVRAIAMQAAREPRQWPGVMRDLLDRCIGTGDAGVERGVDIDPRRGDDPEQEKRQRTKVPPRVGAGAESEVESALDMVENAVQHAAAVLECRCGWRYSGKKSERKRH